MKKILTLVLIGAALFGYFNKDNAFNGSNNQTNTPPNQALYEAYQNRRSDVQVQGSGIVTRILSDDREGSQHQRFILKLKSGPNILIAHNIDLAPRINSLRKGDSVEFYGEYEWSSKGGVVHWTHLDPNNRHINGWLLHHGSRYE